MYIVAKYINPEDDIENVSVGGMDVSDIEDDDRGPMTTRRSETSGYAQNLKIGKPINLIVFVVNND
jgi:hypothetical protein